MCLSFLLGIGSGVNEEFMPRRTLNRVFKTRLHTPKSKLETKFLSDSNCLCERNFRFCKGSFGFNWKFMCRCKASQKTHQKEHLEIKFSLLIARIFQSICRAITSGFRDWFWMKILAVIKNLCERSKVSLGILRLGWKLKKTLTILKTFEFLTQKWVFH